MATLTIPVPDAPYSRFQILLSGQLFRLSFYWNDRMNTWSMAIDDESENRLASGIRLILDFPLTFGIVDDRFPNGEFLVVDPSGRQRSDPGRTAWQDTGEDLRLIFREADVDEAI